MWRGSDRPNFGYLYDTFHANIEEKDPVGVDRQRPSARSRHVHISENDRGAPGSGQHPARRDAAGARGRPATTAG